VGNYHLFRLLKPHFNDKEKEVYDIGTL